jgi:hypothetical protein
VVDPGTAGAASYHRAFINHNDLSSLSGSIDSRVAASYATTDDEDISFDFILFAVIHRIRPLHRPIINSFSHLNILLFSYDFTQTLIFFIR